MLEQYFASAEDKALSGNADANESTADGLLTEIANLKEQRWQEEKTLRDEEVALFYEQSLVTQLKTLKGGYD